MSEKEVETCCICGAVVLVRDWEADELEQVNMKIKKRRVRQEKCIAIHKFLTWQCPHCQAWNGTPDDKGLI